MQIKIISLSLIIIFIITLLAPANILAKEYLQNLGFDLNLDNWTINNGNITAERVTQEHHNGDSSVKITNSDTGSYGIEQTITDISTDNQYLIQVWIKVNQDFTHKARVRVAWYETEDASGSQTDTIDTDQLDQQQDWTHFTKVVTPPENTKSAKFRLILAAKDSDNPATAYFDDVSFSTYEPTPTPQPTNTPTPKPQPDPTATPTPQITRSQLSPTPQLNNANDSDPPSQIDQLRNQIKQNQSSPTPSTFLNSTDTPQNSNKPDYIASTLIASGGILLLGTLIPISKNYLSQRLPQSSKRNHQISQNNPLEKNGTSLFRVGK